MTSPSPMPLPHATLHRGEWRLVLGLQAVAIARKLRKTTLLAFLRENGVEPNGAATKDVLSRQVVDLVRSVTLGADDLEDENWTCPCDVTVEDFLQNEASSSLPDHLQDLLRGMCTAPASQVARFLCDFGESVRSDCRVVLLRQLRRLLTEQAGALPTSPLAMTSSDNNETSPPMALATCEDTKVPSPIAGTSNENTTQTLTITSENTQQNLSKVTITPNTVKIESPNVIATITTNNKNDETPKSTYTITIDTPKENIDESPIRVTPPKLNHTPDMAPIKAPKRPSPKAIIKAGAIVVTDIIASNMYSTSTTVMYNSMMGQRNPQRPLVSNLPTTARTSLMMTEGYIRPWNVPAGSGRKRVVPKRKSGSKADYMKPTLSSASKVRDRVAVAEGPQVKVKGHSPLSPLLPEGNECCVCLNSQREVAFNPCGHTICCKACAEPLRKCPLCRKDISVVLTLYLS